MLSLLRPQIANDLELKVQLPPIAIKLFLFLFGLSVLRTGSVAARIILETRLECVSPGLQLIHSHTWLAKVPYPGHGRNSELQANGTVLAQRRSGDKLRGKTSVSCQLFSYSGLPPV